MGDSMKSGGIRSVCIQGSGTVVAALLRIHLSRHVIVISIIGWPAA